MSTRARTASPRRGRLTWLAIRICFVASDRTIRMTIPRLTVATTINISVLIINNANEDNDDGNSNNNKADKPFS